MNKTIKLLLVALFLFTVTLYWVFVHPWIIYFWKWYTFYTTLRNCVECFRRCLDVYKKIQKMSEVEQKVCALNCLILLCKYWNFRSELYMLNKVFKFFKCSFIALSFLLGLRRRVRALNAMLRRD